MAWRDFVATLVASLCLAQVQGNFVEQVEDSALMRDFVQWASTHSRNYEDAEEFNFRFSIYKDIERQMQAAVDAGAVRPGQLGHNKFSDRSPEEMRGGKHARKLFEAKPIPEFHIMKKAESTVELKASNYKTFVNYCPDSDDGNGDDDDDDYCNDIRD